MGLFVVAFGWARFLADFWPLDSSRIGPNLCASFVIVVGITARNEARTIQRDEEAGEHVGEMFRDVVREAEHPTEAAEAKIADDVLASGASPPIADPSVPD